MDGLQAVSGLPGALHEKDLPEIEQQGIPTVFGHSLAPPDGARQALPLDRAGTLSYGSRRSLAARAQRARVDILPPAGQFEEQARDRLQHPIAEIRSIDRSE